MTGDSFFSLLGFNYKNLQIIFMFQLFKTKITAKEGFVYILMSLR